MMTQTPPSDKDYRRHRLTSYAEIEQIAERVGREKYDRYLDWVAGRLLAIKGRPFDRAEWISIAPLIRRPNLLPVFIKTACLVIEMFSRRESYWEFNDTYTAIRHIIEPKLPEQTNPSLLPKT